MSIETRLLPVGDGAVEYGVRGHGDPTTLFAHGLGGSIEDMRPFAGGVHGTTAFMHFAGHGRSTGSGPVGYELLASELLAVADSVGATQAFGASLGAATLLRILASTPDRFARVVLYLPALLDTPRPAGSVGYHIPLARAIADKDVAGTAAALLATQPAGARDTALAVAWADARAKELVASGDPSVWLRLADEVPLRDRGVLGAVRVPVLVVAQEGDEVHPVAFAESVAAAIPSASLHVFDASGALWGHRRQLRTLISSFLG